METGEKVATAIYVLGILVSLVVWTWFMRKELIDNCTDPDVVMPCFMGAAFWPVVAFFGSIVGLFWLCANGQRLLAVRMIALEASQSQKREQQEMREKAQREIFADVDRMLKESNDDEVRAFMQKLRSA